MTAYAGHWCEASLKGREKGKKAFRGMMNCLQGGVESCRLRITLRPPLIAGLRDCVSLEPSGRVTPQTECIDLGSEMHGKVAAVWIVAGNASATRIGGMLELFFRFLVADETELFSRHGQIDPSRLAVANHPMADGAPHGHHRMHYRATGLVRVTGGTIGAWGVGAVFHRLRLRSSREQEQEEADDRLWGAPHLTRRWRAA